MKEDCPNPQEDCKYYPACFADQHHIYGRAKNHVGKIARKFAELPQNKEQLCRIVHEELHATEGVLPLPDVGEMQEAIEIWRTERYD